MSTFKRSISLLLVLIMVTSMIPARAVAEGYQTALVNLSTSGNTQEQYPEQRTAYSSALVQTIPAREVEIVPEPSVELTESSNTIPNPNLEVVLMDTEGDYTYTVSAENTATITGYTGTEAEIVIPYTLGGYPVTGIGSDAFKGNTAITAVSFETNSLTVIGIYAFSGCSSLESIEIPDTVTNIGGRAFQNCTSLSSVKLPLSWKTVDSYGSNTWGNPYYEGPFVGCSSLKSVTVPEGMTELPAYAFNGSPALEEIHLPETLTEDRGECAE